MAARHNEARSHRRSTNRRNINLHGAEMVSSRSAGGGRKSMFIPAIKRRDILSIWPAALFHNRKAIILIIREKYTAAPDGEISIILRSHDNLRARRAWMIDRSRLGVHFVSTRHCRRTGFPCATALAYIEIISAAAISLLARRRWEWQKIYSSHRHQSSAYGRNYSMARLFQQCSISSFAPVMTGFGRRQDVIEIACRRNQIR